MRARFWSTLALSVCVLCALPPSADGHPAPFSYIDVRIGASGITGTLVVHDFDVAHDLGIETPASLLDAAIAQQQRARLVALVERRIRLLADDVPTTVEWGALSVLADRQSLALAFQAVLPSGQALRLRSGQAAPGTITLDALIFPYDPVHQTFVNVYEGDALRHQAILDFDHRTLRYYSGTRQGVWAVVRTFVPAGIEHILIGPDHVLFLIGLLLLGGSGWALGGIVTAFTIGHSITLSAAALDLVTPPARLIEPAIALSIVFVGVDNLLVAAARQTRTVPTRDIRAWVAGVFGLVHGFGFASVLKEFGLPSGALGWSLFSFNLGVEIGQLLIVLVVASALAAVRRRYPPLAERMTWAGSIGVILAGGYWFVERVFLTGGAS
jgi:hydrogenase/urease accessory protein HupE